MNVKAHFLSSWSRLVSRHIGLGLQISNFGFSTLLFVGLMVGLPGRASALEFQRQTLALPTNAWVAQPWSFADVDGDKRADLLAFDPDGNKLWIYRQTVTGFAADQQKLELPPRTAWMAITNLEPHSPPVLLVSFATGLACFRQAGGVFETQPTILIQTNQVFTNGHPPMLINLPGATNGTSLALPVVTATDAVLFHRDGTSRWQAGEPLPLSLKYGSLHAEDSGWTAGSQPARKLDLIEAYRSGVGKAAAKDPDNEAIEQIVRKVEKTTHHWHTGQRIDVNGDGRKDLVVWGCSGMIDTMTDLHFYRRSPDNRFPEQPTQVLRCSGFPIRCGPDREYIPLYDLNGDGRVELVLAKLKTTVATSSGLVEALMSGGMDWLLTIRTLQNGVFPNRAEASIDFTTIVPPESGPGPFILLDGDFNGDGRPDFMVERSVNKWQVLFSSNNHTWFERQPALSFDLPDGEFTIRDLNGDGRSDLVVQPNDEPRLIIFLSANRSR